MFSSKGLFKAVPCPQRDDCQLPFCWFSHNEPATHETHTGNSVEYDPFTAGAPDSPPSKRRKLNDDASEASMGTSTLDRAITPPPVRKPVAKRVVDLNTEGGPAQQRHGKPTIESIGADYLHTGLSSAQNSTTAALQVPVSSTPSNLPKSTTLKPPSNAANSVSKSPNTEQLSSTAKAVTPPPVRPKPKSAVAKDGKGQAPPKAEPLKPRMVTGGVDWKTRDALLKVLHQRMVDNNTNIREKVKRKEVVDETLRLFDHELVTLALDEEAAFAAQYQAGIYTNVVKQRIHAISKMTDEAWGGYVAGKINRVQRLRERRSGKAPKAETQVKTNTVRVPLIPGFDPDAEISLLKHLQQPLEKLQQYGYVTSTPSNTDLSAARATMKASDGWEKCDRCSARFQVFPGRDEHGRLASGGRCFYHWARVMTGPLSRTDRNTGGKEAKHRCCNQSYGTEGCSESETHVFNDKDTKRLATIWPWTTTPDKAGTMAPVSFDCEMCYTTLGMEVVRVTAISWPSNETLLDVLVRPYGEILDLNTRFSGVSRKMFAEAIHDGELNDDHNDERGRLRKVASPADARQRLFDLITPTTPLIGHAIDNDLNTLRIIHPFVIDTVLLYPHKNGLPYRQSLRNLAFDHLDGRRIQVGDEGHDSKEDAIATSDLVSKAARETWKLLKFQGWKIEDGTLVKDADGGSKL